MLHADSAALQYVKATPGNDSGHRQLHANGLQNTAKTLLIQAYSGGWRSWDIAKTCILEETGANCLIKLQSERVAFDCSLFL